MTNDFIPCLWAKEIQKRWLEELELAKLLPRPKFPKLTKKERAAVRKAEMARRREMCRKIMKDGYLDE